MPTHIIGKLQRIEVLVLACSAGGFKVLSKMLNVFPKNLPIGILVIIHRNARYETNIEKSLAAQCLIDVKVAEEKEAIKNATAYFAPAGYHLLTEPDHTLSLDASEPVNFCRPSIDVAMQSVADVYGAATGAILLSGANEDGARGMQVIRQYGGLTIVQHPETAEVRTMPASAIALGGVDTILTDDQLITLCRQMANYISREDS